MIFKILKYLLFGIIGLIIVVVLIAAPFIIKARSEGDKLYRQYADYTKEVLSQKAQLAPFAVKPEFQTLHPAKFLKMFKIAVSSQQGDRLARVNSLDATMFMFMKMFTLMIRPAYNYNLPMMSVDFIFIGGKRVYVIEIIDPAKIDDANKTKYYDVMRTWMPEVATFKQSATRDWYKDFLADCSIHIEGDRSKDDVLFEIYKTYLNAYLDMAANAEPLSADKSAQVKTGIETYVETLLSKGGPAVEVFEKMLGPEGQREYVRTVMFGLDG